AFVTSCPKLTSFTLHGQLVTDLSIQYLAHGCPLLTKVDLNLCPLVTDEGIRALATGCPLLTSIDIPSSRGITNASLEYLSSGCPQLTTCYGPWNHLTDNMVQS